MTPPAITSTLRVFIFSCRQPQSPAWRSGVAGHGNPERETAFRELDVIHDFKGIQIDDIECGGLRGADIQPVAIGAGPDAVWALPDPDGLHRFRVVRIENVHGVA